MHEWELLRGEQALILFNCHLLSFTSTVSAACSLSLVLTEEQDKASPVSSENIAAFFNEVKVQREKIPLPTAVWGRGL